MRSGRSSLLRQTWHELRRRRVARVGALYAVIAWLILQIAEITYDPLGLPGWALTWTVLAAVLGFPVALVLAWFFEISPRGLIRERGVGPAAGRLFAVIVVLCTVGGVGWWLAEVYAPQRSEARAEVRAAANDINTVAVLPFDDMSAARDQRHLADGIAEELLDRLAQLPGLKVAARTSSFALRDFGGGMEELGRLLKVRWVLEGSVRSAGGRVRVTAQLIDAADGFHVWSETYDRDSDDLFELQDEVTAAIAAELQRRIPRLRSAADATAAQAATTAEPELTGQTLELYLRGRQAWRQRTPESLAQAEALFAQATRDDPEFARGWSGLADTYLLQANYGLRPVHEAIELAEPAAVQAITLDPGLGEAWASIGLLRWSAGQMGPAQRSLEEAMRLDPRYEMAPMWLAGVFGDRGEYAEQRRVLEQAHELNPLEPVINSNLASLLSSQGEVEEARAVLERVLAVTPREALLLRTLAEIEHGQARLTRALELARRARDADGGAPASVALLIDVLSTLEAFGEAEALLTELPQGPKRLALTQGLRLRQGQPELLAELQSQSERLLQSKAQLTPQDRDLLVLSAVTRLAGGAPEEASALLQRVMGERIGIEPGSGAILDAASLLAVALERSGSHAAAARLQEQLGSAAQTWLSGLPEGGNAEAEYGRALVAIFEGRRADALVALEAAYAAGFRQRWRLLHDPRLAPLQEAPALRDLARRIGDDLARARSEAGLIS